jgi:hypothetical protein
VSLSINRFLGQRLLVVGNGLLWKFTKGGQFEFACLISDHYGAGIAFSEGELLLPSTAAE